MVDREKAQRRKSWATRRPEGAVQRLWRRIVFACRWLRSPNAVGSPIVLEPRSVRLLIFLILGNVVVLGLMGFGLLRAVRMPLVARPMPAQIHLTREPEPSPSPGPTQTPLGSGGAIAFSLRRGGNTDIYALNQQTGQLLRLTYDDVEDRSPAWSPDGGYVAFASNRAHNWDIYLLDLASGALIRLTHHPAFDANPSWSPDGKCLAFESYRNGNLDIYVMSTMGKQLRQVTTDPAADYAPAWTHTGEALAFTSLRDGSREIYLHRLGDDDDSVNLTQSPNLDEDSAAWSADGSQLAYVSGSQGHTSLQVATFDWETLSIDQAQSEFFATGHAPAWSPDGENLIYAYERGGRSHVVAASMTGWALFHEIYNTEGLLDDLAWTDTPLSPRVVARAEVVESSVQASLYTELVQPTPVDGAPRQLVSMPGVATEEGAALLSDQVNDSFNALRHRVMKEAGWDYLGELDSAWIPMDYEPASGHSRKSWQICGRAFALDQEAYRVDEPKVELVREEIGNSTYWRVFIRTSRQDGSMGEPLRELPWNLNAREVGGRAEVDGGALRESMPDGYYVDFTLLAQDYGWERVPSLWRWRHFWPDIRWWQFRKTDALTWWDCMQEVFRPEEVESAFGPIPGRED